MHLLRILFLLNFFICFATKIKSDNSLKHIIACNNNYPVQSLENLSNGYLAIGSYRQIQILNIEEGITVRTLNSFSGDFIYHLTNKSHHQIQNRSSSKIKL